MKTFLAIYPKSYVVLLFVEFTRAKRVYSYWQEAQIRFELNVDRLHIRLAKLRKS